LADRQNFFRQDFRQLRFGEAKFLVLKSNPVHPVNNVNSVNPVKEIEVLEKDLK